MKKKNTIEEVLSDVAIILLSRAIILSMIGIIIIKLLKGARL